MKNLKDLPFKVYIDFTNYIPITGDELEKALYAFQTGQPVMFEMGAANKVMNVVPDYQKKAGYFSDAKLSPDDLADMERYKHHFTGVIGKVKEKIQYLLATNQKGLIGKNAVIPELESGNERIENRGGEIKSLGDVIDKPYPIK